MPSGANIASLLLNTARAAVILIHSGTCSVLQRGQQSCAVINTKTDSNYFVAECEIASEAFKEKEAHPREVSNLLIYKLRI